MKIKDIAILGILTALLLTVQIGLAFLPNIELVSLFIILYTLVYKKKVFIIIYAFAILEGLIYGFGLWMIMYFYVWTILALFTMLFRKNQSIIIWACISGGFGLFFGALCSIPYFFIGGLSMGIAYWIHGIPFDIIHAIGNFFITFILFSPMYRLLSYQYRITHNS